MYAIVRQVEYDEEMLRPAESELKAFDVVHAAQPGYIGSVVIDVGAGQRLVLNLWDSEQAAAAARRALEAEVGQLLGPLMTGPSQLIGVGDVLSSDLPCLPSTPRSG
jgi:heme-degrading monooxygenase HmoA